MADGASRIVRHAARWLVSMALVGAVGLLAHLPLGELRDGALLRLTLRSASAQVDVCRDRSAEELAALPVHMRQPRSCITTTVDYRLRIWIDGDPRLDRKVTHRGVRHNRPLIADADLPLSPGPHHVRVSFEPLPPPGLDPSQADSLEHRTFDESVEFPAGGIRLVWLRDDAFGIVPLAER